MSVSDSNMPKSWLDVLHADLPLRAYVTLHLLLEDPSPALKENLPPEMEHRSDIVFPNNCSSVLAVNLTYDEIMRRQIIFVGVRLGHAQEKLACGGNCVLLCLF